MRKSVYQRLKKVPLVLLFILALPMLPSQAYSNENAVKQPQELQWLLASAGIGAGKAASIAASRTGGRALSTSMVKNKRVYRVKVLLPSGRIKFVLVDAQSGRVLN